MNHLDQSKHLNFQIGNFVFRHIVLGIESYRIAQ